MHRGGKVLGLAACFAAGIAVAGLLAVGSTAADTTTSVTTTLPADTTQEATTVTVATTATVEHTTTQRIRVPVTTTAAESSGDDTPVWVWVLLAILAVALVAAIVLLARRGGHRSLSPEERGRRLDNAVSTWAAQGWAVESQTLDSAVLQRGGERMIVGVDASGQITTRPG